MEYTSLGNTGLQVSRFGLGCMRFPPDKKEAIDMVRYAIDHGVTYLDTAYVYGDSEVVTGKALQDGYRQKVTLATKCPLWNIRSAKDFEKYLDEQLKRLQTDYIDIYLLHNLDPGNWEKVKKYDGLSFLDKMVQKGKIGHKAFSIHNTLDAFKEIVDAFSWEMAQIQLNILGEHYHVGLEGLRYGASKGLGMVIMEPLLGGSLIQNASPEVEKLIRDYPEKRSLADWCFRWLYNMPEAGVILSGTSSLEQLKDNIRIFEQSRPGVMSERDLELIQSIRDVYEGVKTVNCTDCRYCMPCPSGINIPELFKLYNECKRFESAVGVKLFYKSSFVALGRGADQCIKCGACQERCPQNLAIPDLLEQVHTELMKQ